jgi:hypothetical protein
MMRRLNFVALPWALSGVVALVSCGGGDVGTIGSPGSPGSPGSVGGTVTGLGAGLSVTLQDDGGDDLTLTTNEPFSFATSLPIGGAYSVSVLAQPVGQACFVANASGVLDRADDAVATVAVVCSSNSSVAGTVTGLAIGTSVTLNNDGVLLPVAANGAFAFPGTLTSGSEYDVSIAVQPAGQTCMVDSGIGIVIANVAANVEVTCQ